MGKTLKDKPKDVDEKTPSKWNAETISRVGQKEYKKMLIQEQLANR